LQSRRGGEMQSGRSLALLRAGAFLCLNSLVAACSNAATASTAPTTAAVAPTAVTAAPPTATPTDTPPDEVTGSLSVFDWAGYDQEIFWQDFTDKNNKITVSSPTF